MVVHILFSLQPGSWCGVVCVTWVVSSSITAFAAAKSLGPWETWNLSFLSTTILNISPARAVVVSLVSSIEGSHHSIGDAKMVAASGSPACVMAVLSDGSEVTAPTSRWRWEYHSSRLNFWPTWGFSWKDNRYVNFFQKMGSRALSLPQETLEDIVLCRCLHEKTDVEW
jgi:hypothetical protein